MTLLPLITAVGQLVVLLLLIAILRFRQKTIDNLIAADKAHNQSIALHWQRMDAIEARLDGKGPDGVENAIRVAVESAIRQGDMKEFTIGLKPTGEGDLRAILNFRPEGDIKALSDNPDYRLFTNPRTGKTISLDMNQMTQGVIDGKPAGAMPLGKLIAIMGEQAFLDAVFSHLEPPPKDAH